MKEQSKNAGKKHLRHIRVIQYHTDIASMIRINVTLYDIANQVERILAPVSMYC